MPIFKFVGSVSFMDKRLIENRSRKKESDEDITSLIRESALFDKILSILDTESCDFVEKLHKEAEKRLQVHSLRCKTCKKAEEGRRVTCKAAFILINIEEGL